MKITVVDRAGHPSEIEARLGYSLMELVRDHNSSELLALCGGCCSCATCHVYVDLPRQTSPPHMSADENDLLESLSHRTPRSRLACQIQFNPTMNGLVVTIAPEE